MALRSDPSRLVYAPIAGIPFDLISTDGSLDESLLTDPRMVEEIDPDNSSQLRPSCDRRGFGRAHPPRRLVELGLELQRAGAGVVGGSLCGDSLAPAMDALLGRIFDAGLGPRCLSRPLQRTADGTVRCTVAEFVDPSVGCADGRTPDGLDESERLRCVIEQVPTDGRPPPPSPAGWFYDDFSAAGLRCESGRIAFTDGAEPGHAVQLRCASPDPGPIGIGTDCGDDPASCDTASTSYPLGLGCDATSGVCLPRCARAADCGFGDACREGWCVNTTCS